MDIVNSHVADPLHVYRFIILEKNEWKKKVKLECENQSS